MTRPRALLQRLLGPRRARASAGTLLEVQAVTPNQAVWTEQDISKQLAEGYEHAVWAYAAVQEITRQVKQTRWLAYRADQELVDGHPILTLLARPNPEQSGATFLEALIAYYVTVGNTYVERVAATPTSPPLELWVKRPDRMRVIPAAGGMERIRGYAYEVAGATITFEPWQVRHVKTWAPLSDWYGLGAIQAAARGIDLFNTGQAQNLALMQNGARPTGAWVSDTELPDTAYTRLKQELREHMRDTRHRGAPLLLEAGLKWQELGISPRELDWLEGQRDAARQIHAAFGVHPVLTGMETGTFENQRQAQRRLLVNVVLPILDQVVAELNAWLAPLYGRDIRINYDRDAYPSLAEDESALWDRALRGYREGIITLNEARDMTGYGETPNGDTFKPSGFTGLLATTPAPRQERRTLASPNPTAYTAERILLQIKWETRMSEWIRERLDEQRTRITTAAKSATTAAELEAIVNTNTNGEDLTGFTSWWLAAAYAGGRHAADAHDFPPPAKAVTPTHARTEPAPLLTGPMLELWGLLFPDTLTKAETHIPKVVGQIEMTTKQELMNLIRDGLDQGLSIPDIAESIDTLYLEEIIPNRSTVIARTETISSTNYGGQQAAKATNLTLRKTWLATDDDRTRDAHRAANGQTVDLSGTYLVDGEPLEYPGDPNGSAANVIQCRCTEVYEETPT